MQIAVMTVSATSSVLVSVLKPVHVECSLSMVHVNQVSKLLCYNICTKLVSCSSYKNSFTCIILDQFFNIDAYPKTITVTSQSIAGSKIGTINFFINEGQANNSLISLFISTHHITIHNNSGEPNIYLNYINPMFHILASNTNDTVSLRYWSPFQFRDLSSAQCVHNSTTYLTIPLDIVLSSDSLYHLGDQVLTLNVGRNHQRSYSRIDIPLRVQAGMDNYVFGNMHVFMLTHFYANLECEDKSQLYDFTTRECVYECPTCGFAPFRLHHTAYCRTS